MLPVLSLICVLYTCHIGPGFASGTQIVQFFVRHGWTGVFLFPILVGLVCGVITYLVLEYARIEKTGNYRIFYGRFYGKYSVFFSNAKDVLFFINNLVVAASIFATAGSVLNMVFGIGTLTGGTLCMVVIILLTMFGGKVIFASAAVITVCLIAMMVFVVAISIGPLFPAAMDYASSGVMNTSYLSAAVGACCYGVAILTFLDTGITMIGQTAKSRRDSILVAAGSCGLLVATLIPLTIIFAANMPTVATENIPMLWALQNASNLGGVVQYVYAFIAMLALVSTGVGFLYAFVQRYVPMIKQITHTNSETGIRFSLMAIIIVVSVLFGQMGLIAIIAYGYTTLSYLMIPLFFVPFLFVLPGRLRKRHKELAAEEKRSLSDV